MLINEVIGFSTLRQATKYIVDNHISAQVTKAELRALEITLKDYCTRKYEQYLEPVIIKDTLIELYIKNMHLFKENRLDMVNMNKEQLYIKLVQTIDIDVIQVIQHNPNVYYITDYLANEDTMKDQKIIKFARFNYWFQENEVSIEQDPIIKLVARKLLK